MDVKKLQFKRRVLSKKAYLLPNLKSSLLKPRLNQIAWHLKNWKNMKTSMTSRFRHSLIQVKFLDFMKTDRNTLKELSRTATWMDCGWGGMKTGRRCMKEGTITGKSLCNPSTVPAVYIHMTLIHYGPSLLCEGRRVVSTPLNLL